MKRTIFIKWIEWTYEVPTYYPSSLLLYFVKIQYVYWHFAFSRQNNKYFNWLTTSLYMTALRRLTSMSCKSFSKSFTALPCCCCWTLKLSKLELLFVFLPPLISRAVMVMGWAVGSLPMGTFCPWPPGPICPTAWATLGPTTIPTFSLHSKQFRTAHVHT